MKSLVGFGDSISAGDFVSAEESWMFLLSCALAKEGVATFNRGIGGDTSTGGVHRFSQDVLALLPAIVLIQFGYNDSKIADGKSDPQVSVSTYTQNIVQLVATVRSNQGLPIVILNYAPHRPSPIAGNGRSYNDNFAPYDAALRELTAVRGYHSIDTGPVSANENLLPDGLHLNRLGHRAYEKVIRTYLLKQILPFKH